ncbi:MAG TPA: protein kinase [Candidatus Eisenbacteria bacterium]|nr:protein kinase [Candidatus Eisenbacteria bacterium]
MIGRTLSRYRIVERLGAGGMGEVYRAHDERLDRDVALKVLTPGRGAPEDRERIRREARTLSQLSHPGISVVFDVASEDGTEFLVMELARGETLQESLRRGPLPEAALREIGAQVADALAAAHDHDIVHRDLKPANVILGADGRTKLLDFGLALRCDTALAASDTTDDAERHLVVGTLAYMSPEQMLGRSVDSRTDLYSLGVLLYEMATGRRPFEASPATALINEVLNAPRVLPASWPASAELARLVLALLEKEPARRPDSAREVAAALRGVGALPRAAAGDYAALATATPSASNGGAAATTRAGGIESVAVLPLSNLSGEPAQEFFADGMTEALIARLAEIRSLRVLSRTTVARYKHADRPLPEIARELGVDAIVEGAISRDAGRVRITARLIDARNDRPLWAQSYERDLIDVLALQADVARAVADEIRVQLTPQEDSRLRRARPVDPEAYEEYLRGRFHWNRRTEIDVRKAIESFGRSIALDPELAPAYAGLADAYVTLCAYNWVPPEEALPRARKAAARALELDDGNAQAHFSMAGVRFEADWDWEGALVSYDRGIALDPNLADGHHWKADVLSALRRPDEAIAEARLAERLDPTNLIVTTGVGLQYFYARRYDEAIAQELRVLEREADFPPALRVLGGAYEQIGRYDEAIETFRRANGLSKEESSAMALLAHAYAKSGRTADARALLEQLRAASSSRYISRYALGAIHAALGESAAALDLLEQSFEARDRGMTWLAVAPRLDPLRGEPRFQDLLRRMRLPA